MEKSNLIPIEKGRSNPTALTLYKIARALNTDVKFFFEFVEQDTEPERNI